MLDDFPGFIAFSDVCWAPYFLARWWGAVGELFFAHALRCGMNCHDLAGSGGGG